MRPDEKDDIFRRDSPPSTVLLGALTVIGVLAAVGVGYLAYLIAVSPRF